MLRSVANEHRRIVHELRALARPSPGFDAQAYLGSPVPALGVRADDLRAVARVSSRRFAPAGAIAGRRLVESLWAGSTFDEKIVAVEWLAREVLPDGATWQIASRWVDSATGWGLSDSLAAGPVATHAYPRADRYRELLEWSRSTNRWRRRASTYALRGWVRAGELDRPFRLLERLLHDPERWVQRGVGTWLRECWKKDAPRTERFLLGHAKGLPPVVVTVATERASKRFRETLRERARGASRRSREVR